MLVSYDLLFLSETQILVHDDYSGVVLLFRWAINENEFSLRIENYYHNYRHFFIILIETRIIHA